MNQDEEFEFDSKPNKKIEDILSILKKELNSNPMTEEEIRNWCREEWSKLNEK